MRVLVIGNGGREHALAWKLAQGERVSQVFVAPGNGGTARDERLENVPITDVKALADFAVEQKITLTVVGPEAALAAGCASSGPPRRPPSSKAPRRSPRIS
jgi:phosphoribosylamine--glycine ligase